MAEAKAEAQESSLPRCLLLLAGGLQAVCQAVSAERFCLLALASRFPTEHVSGQLNNKPMQQTRVSLALVTTAAAKCEMRSIVIIIELSYRYRDNFDLSYRLSIENGI